MISQALGYLRGDRLQQLEPDAEIGKRLVDKVAKVWLIDGEQAWVLLHVEV